MCLLEQSQVGHFYVTLGYGRSLELLVADLTLVTRRSYHGSDILGDLGRVVLGSRDLVPRVNFVDAIAYFNMITKGIQFPKRLITEGAQILFFAVRIRLENINRLLNISKSKILLNLPGDCFLSNGSP